MNFLTFPEIRSSVLKFSAILLLSPMMFSLTGFSQNNAAQQLTLADMITVLRSKKATQPERNNLLAEGVRQRGVTFALNADLEKELRAAGADDGLIAAIREKSPVIKVSATTPAKPEPLPVPVATPKLPDFAFYQNRANANFVLGEYETAITDYSKAIELNPKESTIYFSRALAYLNKSIFTLAVKDFDKVIELDPTDAMAYLKRGSALEKTGDTAKALSDYQKTVELDPTNELAKNALQKLQASLPKPNLVTPTSVAVKETNAAVKETVAAPNTQNSATKNNEKDAEKTSDKTNEPAASVNYGALNSYAVRLVNPVYPPLERQRNMGGLVTVEVTLDEEGKVVSAKASSGPANLRRAAEDAVMKSKFNPVTFNGKIVRATGFINFNFKPN